MDSYVDVGYRIEQGPHWERASALHFASLEADLIPNNDVGHYVDLALAATSEPRRGFFAPYVDLNAWKALAALGERTTTTQAATALDVLDARIEREPSHYRFEDDEHVEIVVSCARAHSSLAGRTAAHLARIIEQGGQFANQARSAVLRGLRPVPAALTDRLTVLAASGNDMALQTLGDLEIRHPDFLRTVRATIEETLNAPEPPPGCFGFAPGLPQLARRALLLDADPQRRLADHCLRLALNLARPAPNRTDAVQALLVLARHFDDDQRKEYFPKILALVQSASPPDEIDQADPGELPPLSTMRINLNFASLPRAALQTAGALAQNPADANEVEILSLQRLMTSTPEDAYAGAHALANLNPKHVGIDSRVLATHPAVWVRQLAARVAIRRDPLQRQVIVQLARDIDPSVRRAVAIGLGDLWHNEPGLAQTVADTLRDDTHWSIRHLIELWTADAHRSPDHVTYAE